MEMLLSSSDVFIDTGNNCEAAIAPSFINVDRYFKVERTMVFPPPLSPTRHISLDFLKCFGSPSMLSDFMSEGMRNERMNGELIRNLLQIGPNLNMFISIIIVFFVANIQLFV